MAVQAPVKDAFTFVGGLNTEGGFFITPENTFKEGVNVVVNVDGSIERRNGIDLEENYVLSSNEILSVNNSNYAYSTGVWETVSGNGNVNFIVVQTGYTLSFYSSSSGTLSTTKLPFEIDLTTYKVPTNTGIIGSDICSYASAYGKLIVTSKSTYPLLIEYLDNTNTISTKTIDLSIRDFKGKQLITYNGILATIDIELTQEEWEGLGISIGDVVYNLYNQGWTDDKINAYKASSINTGTWGIETVASKLFLDILNSIGATPSGIGKYPSNTKSWIYGKDLNDDFKPTFLNKQNFGNSPAPKGKFIINPFSSSTTRPSCCSFYAGRVWFAGSENDDYTSTVFFSQVLDQIYKLPQCYQTNDPTSEVLSDLEDDDGGTIEIPDAGTILGLRALGRGIMVLSSNGVWFISGIDKGFTAASYSVERITSIGCASQKSIIDLEGSLLYWSNSGIVLIQASNNVEYTAKIISDTSIKSLYNSIAVLGRRYSVGAYNSFAKIVFWTYYDNNGAFDAENAHYKNKILALDLRLNAWYVLSIDSSIGPQVTSVLVTNETSISSVDYSLVVNSEEVLSNTDEVIISIPTTVGTKKQFKFLTIVPTETGTYKTTFSDLENNRVSDTKFKDWYSFDSVGIEMPSYFITGYNMGGNGPARQKTGHYLTVFMKRTETSFDEDAIPVNESGCLMQSRWDFTDNSYPGKWAAAVPVYRQPRQFYANPLQTFDDGYPLVISKNKLRGRGKAVQFRFEAESSKDMKIVGWTGTFIGNTNV